MFGYNTNSTHYTQSNMYHTNNNNTQTFNHVPNHVPNHAANYIPSPQTGNTPLYGHVNGVCPVGPLSRGIFRGPR